MPPPTAAMMSAVMGMLGVVVLHGPVAGMAVVLALMVMNHVVMLRHVVGDPPAVGHHASRTYGWSRYSAFAQASASSPAGVPPVP